METELEAKLTSETLQPQPVSLIPKLSHPQGSMSRQLPQVWRTTGPGKSRRTCPKQLISAFRLSKEKKMRMVDGSAIAGFGCCSLGLLAGRISPEETWCWETRLRQCYPAALPAITGAHSEVMIGKRCCCLEAPTPMQYWGGNSSTVTGLPSEEPMGVPYPLGYIPLVLRNGLWDRQYLWGLVTSIASNGRDRPRTPPSYETAPLLCRTHHKPIREPIFAQTSHQANHERSPEVRRPHIPP